MSEHNCLTNYVEQLESEINDAYTNLVSFSDTINKLLRQRSELRSAYNDLLKAKNPEISYDKIMMIKKLRNFIREKSRIVGKYNKLEGFDEPEIATPELKDCKNFVENLIKEHVRIVS